MPSTATSTRTPPPPLPKRKTPQEEFDEAVNARLSEMLIRKAAEAEFKRRTERPAPPMDAALLGDLLQRPHEDAWRAERLHPKGGNMLVIAQRKSGKTTLCLGYARSLIDGADVLGRFEVTPVIGRVGFLNYEVSGHQFARWADDAGIPADRLLVVNLRGRRNPLGHPEDRAQLVALLREHDVEVLFIDPFGRAYTGSNQNDAAEVGAFLSEVDALAADAGIAEVVMAVHAGWNGERARGSSALEDWGDVLVYLVRDEDTDERFLSADGRDVSIDEDRLTYDTSTRSLSLSGHGNRRQAKDEARREGLAVPVLTAISGDPDITSGGLEKALRGADVAFRKGDISKVVASLMGDSLVMCAPRGNAKHYSLTHQGREALENSVPRDVPAMPRGEMPRAPRAIYSAGHGGIGHDGQQTSIDDVDADPSEQASGDQ